MKKLIGFVLASTAGAGIGTMTTIALQKNGNLSPAGLIIGSMCGFLLYDTRVVFDYCKKIIIKICLSIKNIINLIIDNHVIQTLAPIFGFIIVITIYGSIIDYLLKLFFKPSTILSSISFTILFSFYLGIAVIYPVILRYSPEKYKRLLLSEILNSKTSNSYKCGWNMKLLALLLSPLISSYLFFRVLFISLFFLIPKELIIIIYTKRGLSVVFNSFLGGAIGYEFQKIIFGLISGALLGLILYFIFKIFELKNIKRSMNQASVM